ncbi:hypothetical protein MATR_19430 [Marivirga tractuosa]|uniref:Restriction endonuclease type IV Mrr domain-containing protein n=1 Tax=Marivirga tractuosa (strain ATCC 23168 / DSM 4126 / NBRC 15989 / NCIMB 1408 / VKM B-1430 / H-43) TaxID=643867 RepID=E4TNI0_MARTH|nr:restriction endonuclease [Marivirga tractuosa]ADR20437.1 hypothetical protein Ftrac_0431 [Marivirga tractuosa DSM 4126]BDD15118.1 hypothetical protein MATR_19430 [Marivirga tractuosa]
MKIDFSEIDHWAEFEDLAAAYFRECINLDDNQIVSVKVESSGEGPDGGRDILVTSLVDDSIVTFERKWVIQCKFYDTLYKSNLDKINIPTLIREYDASGYLLIAKNSVQAGVTQTFENLRNNCRDGYQYEVWNGNHFINKLIFVGNLHQQFFPKYYVYTKEMEAKMTQIKAKQ